MSDTPPPAPSLPQPVRITALDLSFGQLIGFFVKAGLAAIPAILIVTITVGIGMALLRGLLRFGYWGMHGGYGW